MHMIIFIIYSHKLILIETNSTIKQFNSNTFDSLTIIHIFIPVNKTFIYMYIQTLIKMFVM